MKKSAIVILCVALALLNAMSALAVVNSYASMRFVNRRPMALGTASDCHLDIKTSPADVNFIGKSRQECLVQNRHNVRCQQNCLEQMKLLAAGSAGREMGMYSRTGCREIDAKIFTGATAGQCHKIASTECAEANSMNSYCSKKCAKNAYNLCRQQRARSYGL